MARKTTKKALNKGRRKTVPAKDSKESKTVKYLRDKVSPGELKPFVMFEVLEDLTPDETAFDGLSNIKAGSILISRSNPVVNQYGGGWTLNCFTIKANWEKHPDTEYPIENFYSEHGNSHNYHMERNVRVFTLEQAIEIINNSDDGRNLKALIPLLVNVEIKFQGDQALELNGLVIADDKRTAIVSVITAHSEENQHTLRKKWGFEKTVEKGLGLGLLFYGPPGTGKTKACEVMAEELGLKLQMVDVSQIWSSEPGGAERTIKEIFQKSDPKTTLLLFDECDTLLCSRKHTGVILGATTNQLLSCMERYDGIIVFTTNRAPILDSAVERRLQLKLEFDKPTKELQVRIWKTLIPPQCPLGEDVNFDVLSDYDLAGGHIKNVVLNAARRAIYQKAEKVMMSHFLEAVKDELEGQAAFNQEDDTPYLQGSVGTQVGSDMKVRRVVRRDHGSQTA